MPLNKSPVLTSEPRHITWLLRIACAVMLLGHGMMCWNGQMPLRALLWDEGMVSGLVKTLTGMEWDTWASSMQVDGGINNTVRAQAWLFFLFAVSVLIPMRRKRAIAAALYLTIALNLLFLGWLKFYESGEGIAHWLEHASQICLPVVLCLFVFGKDKWRTVATVSIAITFVTHGLLAIGQPSQIVLLNHPRPGSFVEMTMLCLGLEFESHAGSILLTAGILDIIAAAAIFLRGWPRILGLSYMFAWGLATAIARPWAYFEPTAAMETLIRWLPELFYRSPHFFLPLALLLALRASRAKDMKSTSAQS